MSDGHIVYQGYANKSAAYFRNIGYPSSTFSNPADIFMKVLSVNYPKLEADEQKISDFVHNY